MLKTRPTKAGPPLLPGELSPEILTVDGKPELDSAEDTPLIADLEDMELGRFDSKGESANGRHGGVWGVEK